MKTCRTPWTAEGAYFWRRPLILSRVSCHSSGTSLDQIGLSGMCCPGSWEGGCQVSEGKGATFGKAWRSLPSAKTKAGQDGVIVSSPYVVETRTGKDLILVWGFGLTWAGKPLQIQPDALVQAAWSHNLHTGRTILLPWWKIKISKQMSPPVCFQVAEVAFDGNFFRFFLSPLAVDVAHTKPSFARWVGDEFKSLALPQPAALQPGACWSLGRTDNLRQNWRLAAKNPFLWVISTHAFLRLSIWKKVRWRLSEPTDQLTAGFRFCIPNISLQWAAEIK